MSKAETKTETKTESPELKETAHNAPAVIPPADVPQRASDVPLTLDDLAGAPSGLENITTDRLLVPRIVLLQPSAPQLKKEEPEYIRGSEMGDFCDVGVGDIWKESIEIIPCAYNTIYLEWAPRETGIGLVKNHGRDRTILQQCKLDEETNKWVLPNGNHVVETDQYFVLNKSAGYRRSFIPLAVTQLSSSRQWNTRLVNERLARRDGTTFQAPIYYRAWRATPRLKKNAKGSWYIWHFMPAEPMPENTIIALSKSWGADLLKEAIGFYQDVQDGKVQPELSKMDESSLSVSPSPDDNIPF